MGASLGTYTDWSVTPTTGLAHILKEFYLGPVRAQLNNEVMALQLFQKATVDWQGRLCYIPIHVSRNSSVEYLGEGDAFTDADGSVGSQGYEHLTIQAHFLYGHFEITGPAVASAKSGGKGAFIGWMEAEMKRLVNDVKNTADNNLISGGGCIGYLVSSFLSVGADDWAFDGDYAKMAVAVAGTGNVRIARQDSPGFQADGTTPVNTLYLDDITASVAVTASNETAGTITIGAITDTSAITQGSAFPVFMTGADLTATANQPRGVFANLSQADLFGVDKAGVDVGGVGTNTDSLPALQPYVFTVDTSVHADPNTRADLTAERMQQVIDEVSTISGLEPDCILCHPTTRAQYVSMMTGTNSLQTTTRGKATDADVGFLNLSYQNIPIKYARHVPRGMMMFLNTSTWKIAELKAGGFADLDGTTILRESLADRWRGFWCWYYNLACLQPNANALLTGISIT